VKKLAFLLALAAAVLAGDSAAATHALAVTAVSGGSYLDGSTSTVYYDGAHAGSFTVSDTVNGGTGPFQVTYPSIGAGGWAHAAETLSGGGAVTSSPYTWAAGSTTPPAQQTIIAVDSALQTSQTTLTFVNDTTGPTGVGVSLSGGPNFSTASVPLTLTAGTDAGSGVNPASGVVERASAAASNGTCGTFGAFAGVTLASNADTTVASGSCYRYRYRVADRVGNQTTSPNSADTLVDTSAPTAAATAPDEVTGAGDQFWSAATNTLWFRPAGAGSFTLKATAADPESGTTQMAFPDLSTLSGWSGSTGGNDPGASPYASPVNYTWTAGAASPGAKTMTVTNGSGLTGTAAVTITADSTAPTGQTVAINSGPWYTTASVPLTLVAGTDAGAGVDPARTVVQRAAAPLTNGVCGTFGAFAAVTLSNGADGSVASGNCYRYESQATDNVGNVSALSAASSDAKIDATAPTTPTLLFTALSRAAASGGTLYFSPTGTGSFTVTATSSDPESGVASYTFPTLAGFTAVGSGSTRTYTFRSSASAPSGTQAVYAKNGAGLTSSPGSFALVADSTAPVVTVLCDGKPCLATSYSKAVSVTMSATDTGSGVDSIRYTTDGSAPTLDDGQEYTKPVSLNDLTRLRVQAYDKAGNASAPVILTVNSTASKLLFGAPVRVAVKAKGKFLQARITSTKRIAVIAVLRGAGLKTPSRWRFAAEAGATIVKIRLPSSIKRKATYRLTWTAVYGSQRITKTTTVSIG
jgi:hypothetical protein